MTISQSQEPSSHAEKTTGTESGFETLQRISFNRTNQATISNTLIDAAVFNGTGAFEDAVFQIDLAIIERIRQHQATCDLFQMGYDDMRSEEQYLTAKRLIEEGLLKLVYATIVAAFPEFKPLIRLCSVTFTTKSVLRQGRLLQRIDIGYEILNNQEMVKLIAYGLNEDTKCGSFFSVAIDYGRDHGTPRSFKRCYDGGSFTGFFN
jgi:hypothetical protein